MARRKRARSPGATATITINGLEAALGRVAGLQEEADRVAQTFARRIVRAAKATWPVKTGRSKRGLGVQRGRPAKIRGLASYTGRIRRRGVPPGITTWQEMIVEPANARRAELLDMLGNALRRKLRKAGHGR